MQVIFHIDRAGNVTSEVQGGNGTNCLDATKPYEDALGDTDPRREMKPEASLLNTIATSQQVKACL